jgi:hypothetical protein
MAGRDRRATAALNRRQAVAALALPALPALPAGAASTLRVGPGRAHATLAAALAAARDGDLLLLAEGIYRADVGAAERTLTIRGEGSGAVLQADGAHCEGKATLVVRGHVTLENLEFRGARVPDGNGAGVRFESGQLAVRRCRFFDNEMGLLSAAEPAMALAIDDCDFGAAPRHAGLLHHLLYVGAIGRFTLTRSRFADGWRGHLVKTRARVNEVRANRLGPGGAASYELEFPNGGDNTVVGNVIVQSAETDNPALLSMGAEGQPARGRLVLAGNQFVNHAGGGRFCHLWGDVAVQAHDNRFFGTGEPGLAGGFERLPLAAWRDSGGPPR